ncbi:isochorismatase family protein [Streptomyces sp. NBC_00145]|uniref:isochorismatase family protein n=1 Tax=Streptomyces sp. NBC_00145 TaxID=2975666 RepID=UPI002E19D828
MTSPGWIDEVQEQYAGSGLGGRLTPGQRPAVVVVDLIRGFTDPQCPPGSDLDAVVTETARVLDAARAVSVPVVFTTIAFAPDELDSTVWLRKMPALRVLIEDTPWVDIDERLTPRADEPVLAKRAASAFFGTALAKLLTSWGTDSVLVCGATTSGCVRATAIDACALDLPVFLPRQCVGDRAQGPHQANLLDIDAKYGDVIGVADALAILRESGSRS